MSRGAARWLPVLVVVAVVVGIASSVGAQVGSGATARTVWAASCVQPGGPELVVYGRGWAAGSVGLEVTDQQGRAVGNASVVATDRTGAGGVFQGRVPLAVTAASSSLRLVATQSGRSSEHELAVSGSCSPTIAADVGALPCALPGSPVSVTVTVRGAPSSAFVLLFHHADLHGPAEAVTRAQPDRPAGEYAFPLTVPNVPNRVIPITVEGQRNAGGFVYATTSVGLPPSCPQPSATSTTSPPPPSGTAPATSTATTAPTSPGPPTSLLPSFDPARPSSGGAAVGVTLSPTIGRAGEATTVSGRGFTPSSTVTLRWRPGIGQWAVRAGGDGSFRTQVLVLPNDLEGPRLLEVLGAAPVPYLVVPGSDRPAYGGVFVRG